MFIVLPTESHSHVRDSLVTVLLVEVSEVRVRTSQRKMEQSRPALATCSLSAA